MTNKTILGIPTQALGEYKALTGNILRAKYLGEGPEEEDIDGKLFLRSVYPDIGSASKRTTEEIANLREMRDIAMKQGIEIGKNERL